MTTGLYLLLNIGTSEMMLILFVALFLFGGKKLPELARGLGRGIREFKDASETIKRDISDQINNFEEDIETVKTDIKAITQDSVVEEEVKEEATPQTEDMEHQYDISHSNQYYQNYDYSYPGDATSNAESSVADGADTSVSEDAVQETATVNQQNTTEIDESGVTKDAKETGSATS